MKESTRAYEIILLKQELCARRKGIPLTGSAGARGRKMYTPTVDDNLFQDLQAQTRADILAGDGGELQDTTSHPAKMRAVHSSSALGVNIFEYWNAPDRIPVIAEACGLCRNQPGAQPPAGNPPTIRFEQKFQFGKGFSRASNMDVLIASSGRRCSSISAEGRQIS